MTYAEKRVSAEQMVRPFVIKVNQYEAIKLSDALSLLGEELFADILTDKPLQGSGM